MRGCQSEQSHGFTNKSVVYDALSSPRRRFVIRRLDEADTEMSLGDLARAVVEWEQDPETDADDVRISLHHVHLPCLSEAGIVRYTDEKEVSLTESVPLETLEMFEDA